MTYAVRVEEDYVGLMGRHVAEGQSIVPGVPLLDIMTPEGVVETIMSEGWGIIAHVEGHRVLPAPVLKREDGDDDDDRDDGETGAGRAGGNGGGSGVVFSKGDVICHIVARSDNGAVKTGLNPRHSNSLMMRRMGAMAPRG